MNINDRPTMKYFNSGALKIILCLPDNYMTETDMHGRGYCSACLIRFKSDEKVCLKQANKINFVSQLQIAQLGKGQGARPLLSILM